MTLIKILSDQAFWAYGVNFCLALYGFGLFVWWWKKIGHATEVYAYITLLFLTEIMVYGGNVHIRILKAADPMEALRFSDSLVWAARTWVHAAVLAAIIFRMTIRVIGTLKKEMQS